MNFNEAVEILNQSGFRVINEMAKAARNRILDRLNPKKKAIYLLGRFFEKNGDTVRNKTLHELQEYVEAKEPVVNLSWEDFKTALDIDSKIPHGRTNPHIGNTGIMNLGREIAAQYQQIVTTIDRSKDQVDRDYVDKIYNFYRATKNGVNPTTAYEQNDLGQVIDWLRDNEAEAAERFGVHWDNIKKALRRFTDTDFEGTDEDAFDQFLAWYRAKRNNQELPELSDEVKDKLVNIALAEDSVERYGNYVWVLRRNAVAWLGQSLEDYQNTHNAARAEAQRRNAPIIQALDAASQAVQNARGEAAEEADGEVEEHTRRRYTIRYVATGDNDVCSVWTEADHIITAIQQVYHDHWDIKEILSVTVD